MTQQEEHILNKNVLVVYCIRSLMLGYTKMRE